MKRTPRWISESLLLGSLLSLLGTSCDQEAPDEGVPPNGTADTPAPDPLMVRPVDRLTAKIDALDRVALTASKHPWPAPSSSPGRRLPIIAWSV